MANSSESPRIKVLFLGDNGHHKPIERAADLLAPLARAGIDMAYTDDLNDLINENLARYDGLIIYANHTQISPKQEEALLSFVENGKGLIALHCASYCFLNSPKYISLVGGQFESHKTGVFRTRIVDAKHPALKGVQEFEAWDETYKHHRLTGDRHVLMVREEDGKREPWTWVRTQGKGRVFYTASGHDERVFRNPDYHRLVIQGIRWAVGRPDHEYNTKPFEYLPGELPDYRAGKGARLHKMQAPLTPAESMKHLSVPGGFRVELFASEPDIVKPIAIAWDRRGRAYIAETLDYPNNKQLDGKGHDRIVLAEDTNGDGKADKFTVFADKLSIPTSMVYANGGLIVAQAPDILFLKDTDGDGKADVHKVLFTGFHTNDTHAGPSNLRLGLDNWIYATVGYAGFDGQVGGKRYSFRQGLFRFKPDGSELEFLGSTSNNTWGLSFDETGEIFYSTANGEHSSYLAIPNRYFESVRGLLGKGTTRMADYRKIHPITAIRQVDFHDGFTAAAGHALYTARQFPKSFWNRIAFVAEPTGHLVAMCLLDKQGSNFVTHDRFNLLASTDEWTSPIAAEVGPDGAVWVLDWYNYIVQHNPTPPGFKTGKGNAYVTPLRDKKHGRIYRIVSEHLKQISIPNNAPRGLVDANQPPELDWEKATPAQLVGVLEHVNMFWRLQAQRRLVERGSKDALPVLLRLIDFNTNTLDVTAEHYAVIHALWTMHGLGGFDKPDAKTMEVLQAQLQQRSAGVRRAALSVLPRTDDSVKAILKAKLLRDPEPLVRRAALLALSEMPPSNDAGAAIHAELMAPENGKDRWIPLAATCAAARHDVGFLLAALKAKTNTDAVRRVVRIVAEHYARGESHRDFALLVNHLKDASSADADVLLEGLAAGWPKSKTPKLDDATREALVAVMPRLGPNGQLHLATLAGRWGMSARFQKAMAGLRKTLLAVLADEKKSDTERIESAQRLSQMHPDRAVLESLLAEVSPKASPALSAGILDAAGQATSPELAAVVIDHWGQLTPRLRQKGIAILLGRPEWSRALLDALDKGTVSATDLSLDQSQQLTNHPDKKLADRARAILARGGRLPSPDRKKVLDEYMPLVEKTGDARKGFEVFKSICAKCHRHGDIGETIAPNLTGFNVHPKSKILQKMLDPNSSVEGNFRQYTVTTKAGRVINGLLASETKTALEIVDTEAKRHVVLRDDIEEMTASNRTIMPEGFEKQLSKDNIVDLLEFLTAKGKYAPIPLDKVATVVSTQGMFSSKDAGPERLLFRDWKTKTFNGVPFQLVDPQKGRVKNVILLHSPNGAIPPKMPKSVTLPCNTAARAIHFLSGVSGWGYPASAKGSVSLIVRLHYADGKTEDQALKNGEHFADYIRRVDVPQSQFAFALREQQIRYFTVTPDRGETIKEIELLKGPDRTAPVVMAVTVETR
ncbi:MAG TPA: PVC-type heme-binding CxxCH protein [Gemmataceae bacterium]|nr:PVC-type heme-binding CxxCH protein [Gemmataceae bacterium]